MVCGGCGRSVLRFFPCCAGVCTARFARASAVSFWWLWRTCKISKLPNIRCVSISNVVPFSVSGEVQATGTRVLPRRVCLGVPHSQSVLEAADRAVLPEYVRHARDVYLINGHAVHCPFLHSPCWWSRPVWRQPLLVSLGLPCMCVSRVWLCFPSRLSCCLSELVIAATSVPWRVPLVQFVVVTLSHFSLSGEVFALVVTVGFPFCFLFCCGLVAQRELMDALYSIQRVLLGAQSSPLFRLWHSGVTTLSLVSSPVAFVSTFATSRLVFQFCVEFHTCCFSFRQQASVSQPRVSAREFRTSFRILKMPVVLNCLEHVRHARVMAYTSSMGMQCIVHFFTVPVGGVGLSCAVLCSYLSACPACVSLAYGAVVLVGDPFFCPLFVWWRSTWCCGGLFCLRESSWFWICTCVS